MNASQATVYVVDDEADVREAIGSLCRSTGLQVRLYESTEEFVHVDIPSEPSCLVLDVRFPATAPTGLELQRTLTKSGIWIPIVFISGHADVRISVEAMKRGAIEFLPKPFREQELLDAIRHGIERDSARLERDSALRDIRARVGELTAREHDIMMLLSEGLLAKQIAAKLRVSEVTVKVHRARLMRKLKLRSLVELVRLVDGMKPTELHAMRPDPKHAMAIFSDMPRDD